MPLYQQNHFWFLFPTNISYVYKKMTKNLFVTIILGLFVISSANAADGKGPNDTEWLLYSELGIATMSYLASEDPETYGGVIILASPFFASFGEGEKSNSEYGLGIAAFAAYGAYNISLKDEEKSTVFRNNFLLFNAVLLTAYFTKQLSSSDASNERGTQTGFAVIPGGGLAYVNHRF